MRQAVKLGTEPTSEDRSPRAWLARGLPFFNRSPATTSRLAPVRDLALGSRYVLGLSEPIGAVAREGAGCSSEGSYLGDVLPGMLVVPLGVVAVTIAAMEGTGGEGAWLASGVLDTAQQVGNAVGLAVIVSLAVGRTEGLLSAGADPSVAATGGFSLSFGAASGVLATGALLAFFASRIRGAPRVEDSRPAGETR